jgi:hypothetical protein
MSETAKVDPLIPGTEEYRTYAASPEGLLATGRFEFTFHHAEGGTTLSIPNVGPNCDPKHPQQEVWVNTAFAEEPGIRHSWSSTWVLADEQAAQRVEGRFAAIGRLRERLVLTSAPASIADIVALNPADARSEEFEWILSTLPDMTRQVRYCHLVAARKKVWNHARAWCACFAEGDRSVERPWFEAVTRRGQGRAPVRVDRAGRPMYGYRLDDTGHRKLIEAALAFPANLVETFRANWGF